MAFCKLLFEIIRRRADILLLSMNERHTEKSIINKKIKFQAFDKEQMF